MPGQKNVCKFNSNNKSDIFINRKGTVEKKWISPSMIWSEETKMVRRRKKRRKRTTTMTMTMMWTFPNMTLVTTPQWWQRRWKRTCPCPAKTRTLQSLILPLPSRTTLTPELHRHDDAADQVVLGHAHERGESAGAILGSDLEHLSESSGHIALAPEAGLGREITGALTDGPEGLDPGVETAGEGLAQEIATGGGVLDHALEIVSDELCLRGL